MVEQGKRFRTKGIVAPYRKPVSSSSRRKSSFLGKIKSLFKCDENIEHREVPGLKKRHIDDDRSSTVSIPGGFFGSHDLPSPVRSVKCRSNFQISEPATALDTRAGEASSDTDESCTADISNAKLADFFSKKGGEPLSEMEMEGVRSLMKKANRTAKPVRRDSTASGALDPNNSTDLLYSRVLKHSRAPSVVTAAMCAPAFIPKYDYSFGSQSLANTSNGTSSSRRRVFDYSSLPSPYKTTVYKYSVADSSRGKSKDSETASVSKSMICKPSSGKKLSNTASALVSLLDNDSHKSDTANQLANPYSSHVNQIRKYKKSLPAFQPVKQEPTRPAPLKSSALQELENTKAKPVTEVLPKPQQQNSLEKYRPMRSSSLRSNVVKADESPERNPSEHEPLISKASTFDFQYHSRGKPDESPRSEFHTNTQPKEKSSICPDFSLHKSQSKKYELPDNNSDGDISDTNNQPSEPPKPKLPFSTSITTADVHFDFGKVLESNVDPSTIDGQKVQDFRTLFIF